MNLIWKKTEKKGSPSREIVNIYVQNWIKLAAEWKNVSIFDRFSFFVWRIDYEIMRLWANEAADCDEKLLLSTVYTFTLNLVEKKKKFHKKQNPNVKISQTKLNKFALMRMLAEPCQIKHLAFSAMWNGSNKSNRIRDATWWDQFVVCLSFFVLLKIELWKVRWSSKGPRKCPDAHAPKEKRKRSITYVKVCLQNKFFDTNQVHAAFSPITFQHRKT